MKITTARTRLEILGAEDARLMPSNERSAAVLQKLGFQQEGQAKSYLKIAGRWEDHVLTSKINPAH